MYQQTKRKDFEDQIRRQRQVLNIVFNLYLNISKLIGIWCKYGLWEASQKEFERARYLILFLSNKIVFYLKQSITN